MTAKLAVATDNETAKKRTVQRKPRKIAVSFNLFGPDGSQVPANAGYKLEVREVYRDMVTFADALTDNPSGFGLYAKVEVPFAEAEKA